MCIQKIEFSFILFKYLFISFKCQVVNFYNINASLFFCYRNHWLFFFFFWERKSLAINALPCMCLSKSIIFQSYNLFLVFDHYLRNQFCSSAHNIVLALAVLLVSVPVINIERKTWSFFNNSWTSYQRLKNESLN